MWDRLKKKIKFLRGHKGEERAEYVLQKWPRSSFNDTYGEEPMCSNSILCSDVIRFVAFILFQLC